MSILNFLLEMPVTSSIILDTFISTYQSSPGSSGAGTRIASNVPISPNVVKPRNTGTFAASRRSHSKTLLLDGEDYSLHVCFVATWGITLIYTAHIRGATC
jgi:hypothetical protein